MILRQALLVILLLGQFAYAQVPDPTGSLSTDKETYEMFEPVIVTSAITNQTSERLGYGIPSPGVPKTSIYFELVFPDSFSTSDTGFAFGRRHSPPRPGYSLTFDPGREVERSFNALLNWPLWHSTGQYHLRLLHIAWDSTGNSAQTTLAQTTIEVTYPSGVDTSLVHLAQELVSEAFVGFDLSPDEDARIDSIAGLTMLPPHLKEFLRFAHVVSAYSMAGGTATSEVASRYSAFISTYPNSVYRLSNHSFDDFMYYSGEDEPPYDSTATVRVKVFLEGSFDAVVESMRTDLQVPLREPYDVDPWFHVSYPVSDLSGAGLSSQHPAVVDYVLIGAYDSASAMLVDMQASQLTLSGATGAGFVNLPFGRYRIVVDHRNHIAIASDTLVDFTNGFAEHDFTTGHAYVADTTAPPPQKEASPGVYAMWAGDANADGQVTAGDFNEWLTDTKAAVTGYVPTDFDMNTQVTAGDFNVWLANTKKAATTGVPGEWLGRPTRSPWYGSGSEALPKTSADDRIDVKYEVNGSNAGGFLNAEAFARTELGDTDTLGSYTFDFYYDGDELEYGFPLAYTHWSDDGYVVDIKDRSNEYGRFVRVELRIPWVPDTVSWDFGQTWSSRLIKLRFYPKDGPIVSHDVGFNLFSLSMSIVEDGVIKEHPNLIPRLADVFQY